MFLGAIAFLVFLVWRPPPPPVVEVNAGGFDPAIASAILETRDAARGAPRSAEKRGRMGQVLLAHEVWAESRRCFEQAMALDPRELRWPYLLGVSRLADSPSDAALAFERAVRLSPERESAPRLKLAQVLLGLGRLDEAESLYRHVYAREPNSAVALLGLGRVAAARDHWSVAVDFLNAAAADASTRKAAHRLLLNVNQQLGRTNEAGRNAKALADLPNDEPPLDPYLSEVERLKTGEEAWINTADEWIKKGQVSEAAELLEKTLKSYPRSDRALFFLGRARLRLGDARGAESILTQAVDLAPDSIEAQLQLGATRLYRGRPKEAQACFRAAIKAKPNLGEAWFNLGLSLGAKSERPECIRAFREAIRLRPNLFEAYLGLAVILRAEGELQAAALELRRALALGPPDALREKLFAHLALVEPGSRGAGK